METCLYDTSWTLHTITHPSPSFSSLCRQEERALRRPATQLHDYLSTNLVQKQGLYENEQPEIEKIGPLHEVKFRVLEHPAILITVTHERCLSKFILYGADDASPYTLLMTKATTPLVKKFTNFLFDKFAVSTVQLKLPSPFLYDTLQDYLTLVTTAAGGTTNPLTRSTLSSLRLTFSFAPPVAPKLKTIDVDIPLASLIARTPGRSILTSISTHLERATGIYPLAIGLGTDAAEGVNNKALARISKVSCAAFAISVEGRLKYTAKAVEGAVQCEDAARKANQGILDAIVVEAARWQVGTG